MIPLENPWVSKLRFSARSLIIFSAPDESNRNSSHAYFLLEGYVLCRPREQRRQELLQLGAGIFIVWQVGGIQLIMKNLHHSPPVYLSSLCCCWLHP